MQTRQLAPGTHVNIPPKMWGEWEILHPLYPEWIYKRDNSGEPWLTELVGPGEELTFVKDLGADRRLELRVVLGGNGLFTPIAALYVPKTGPESHRGRLRYPYKIAGHWMPRQEVALRDALEAVIRAGKELLDRASRD